MGSRFVETESEMNAMAIKSVGELAVENPNVTRIFEKFGIDYCCGGHRPLAAACAAAKVSVDDVLSVIEQAQTQSEKAAVQRNWQKETLSALIEHITGTHHVYVKEELPRLLQLIANVVSAHGERHPELLLVQQIFGDLGQELSTHLMKEEQILFPYIAQAERSATTGEPLPHSCFGTLQNPVRMMMMEHDSAGVAVRELRQTTANYTVPADGCVSYKTLYEALQAFEEDLHQHIHLENNILFPRAMEFEGSSQ
jgi:regulator of cell morphogenesis and NO signaling